MREYSNKPMLRRDTLMLHRGSQICCLLRQEGILAENSHVVMHLADRLLRSLRNLTDSREGS